MLHEEFSKILSKCKSEEAEDALALALCQKAFDGTTNTAFDVNELHSAYLSYI